MEHKDYTPWKSKGLKDLSKEVDLLKQEIKELRCVVISLTKKLNDNENKRASRMS